MSSRTTAAPLLQAMKQLSLHWEATGEAWRDAKSAEFESTYLHELPHHLGRASEAIGEIDTILRKVRADCE